VAQEHNTEAWNAVLNALGDSIVACCRRGLPGSPVKKRHRPAVLTFSRLGLRLRLNTWLTPEGAVEPGEHALLATVRGVVAIGRRVLILLGRLDRSLRTIDSLADDE